MKRIKAIIKPFKAQNQNKIVQISPNNKVCQLPISQHLDPVQQDWWHGLKGMFIYDIVPKLDDVKNSLSKIGIMGMTVSDSANHTGLNRRIRKCCTLRNNFLFSCSISSASGIMVSRASTLMNQHKNTTEKFPLLKEIRWIKRQFILTPWCKNISRYGVRIPILLA